MGAVPGGSLLSGPGPPGPGSGPVAFDVESFRTAGRRVVLREVDLPVLVLGSAQPNSVVDADRVRRSGVSVVRRRSGGGAVLLLPGAQIWADLWVPRDDPLWSVEPRASAVLAGEWWARALSALPTRASSKGPRVLSVHRGPSVPAPGSDIVCFAGVGPGEVLWNGRKITGLAQWRSREGALVHGCAYRRWDPAPLVDLLDLASGARRSLVDSLRDAATGLEERAEGSLDHDQLIGALPEPTSWEVVRA